MPTFALRKGRQQGVACILAAQGLLALGLLWAGARLGSRTLLEQQPAYTFVEIVLPLMYFNEHELLEAKLEEAYDVADLFVISEAPFTFQGKPKPLHFAEVLCQRFARFAPKIAHVVIGEGAVAPTPEGIRLCEETLRENGFNMSEVNCVAWQREFQSRMTFVAAAELLGVGDEDAVLVSDVDEIPTAAALLEGANLLWNGVGEEGVAIPVVDLRMQAYSLSLYHRVAGPKPYNVLTNRAKMFQYRARRTCSLQSLRTEWLSPACPQHKIVHSLEGAGIHATFFLTPDKIRIKLDAYSHTEYSKPLNISSMLAEEKDPQGWWMERIDPEADANLLRFSPETRVLLLAHSEALHAVQLAA